MTLDTMRRGRKRRGRDTVRKTGMKATGKGKRGVLGFAKLKRERQTSRWA
jgi:hypothetical protein